MSSRMSHAPLAGDTPLAVMGEGSYGTTWNIFISFHPTQNSWKPWCVICSSSGPAYANQEQLEISSSNKNTIAPPWTGPAKLTHGQP